MTMLISANIFQPLIDVFEAVIKFFHDSVGVPWGWSIVLLTVAVRLVLVPLMLKQFHSMQALQAHAPELKKLQTKYKDDKQRLNQETMRFYQENKINPAAACLPLVAQIPVLISLFYMLRTSLRDDICHGYQVARRAAYATAHPHIAHAVVRGMTYPCGGRGGSGFLFIKDLTDTAHGATLIILLVLYVGTQMGTQVIMASPTMDQNQRRLMLLLPLVFTIFVFRFPAGVLVYWVTANTWMLGQQLVFKQRINRLRPPQAVAVDPGARSEDERGSGLGTLLRGGAKASPAPAAVTPSGRSTAPPPSPRKKKKRSGRRR